MTATAGGTARRPPGVPPTTRSPRPAWCWAAPALALVAAVLTGVWVGAFPLPPGAVVVTLLDRPSARSASTCPAG